MGQKLSHLLKATRERRKAAVIYGFDPPSDHLGVVVDEQLGHTALSVHQEAISPPFLGQRGLVTRGNQRVQLPLATAHQLDKLRGEKRGVCFSSTATFGARREARPARCTTATQTSRQPQQILGPRPFEACALGCLFPAKSAEAT